MLILMKNIKGIFIAVTFCALLTYTSSAQEQFIINAEFSYSGVKELDIKGAFCEVKIKAGGGNSVSCSGDIKGGSKEKDQFKIMHNQNGSTVKVWIEAPNNLDNIDGQLTFTVPKNVNLLVHNKSGNITAEGLKGEKFTLETSSGSITIKNIQTNPHLSASSGNIKVTDLTGNLDVKTSSGRQNLYSITGNILSIASSGKVRFNNIKGNINANCSSGGLHLENTRGSSKLRTSSGSIEGISVILTGDSEFQSSSGRIKMQLKHDLKDLSFDLTSGSGLIFVWGKQYTKNHIKEGGKLLIKGVSSSGRQVYDKE